MDNKKGTTKSNRFIKLSLKKNRLQVAEEAKKLNRSSDVIILDESFDRLSADFPKPIHSSPKIYSPIVIDSSDLSHDGLPEVVLTKKATVTSPEKEPSRTGNVSFNCSREEVTSDVRESRPSMGGWSPAQSILCATPKYHPVPSSPKDKANDSIEQCSLKKIQQSHRKLLNDLYGESWKKCLFKTISQNMENFNSVSKKLNFDEDIHYDSETTKKLYVESIKRRKVEKKNDELDNTEKKSKKKLYTEQVPCTPILPKRTTVKDNRNVATTTKKKHAMSVTELVEVMNTDIDKISKKLERVPISSNVSRKVEKVPISSNVSKKVEEVPVSCNVSKKVEVPILSAIENFKTLSLGKVPTSSTNDNVKRLSFIASLADDVPPWRCHVEAIQYRDNYMKLREQLTRRLFAEYNKHVFDDAFDADMPVVWDTKLRTTAGLTHNRLKKTSTKEEIRTSSIKLSSKVLDRPQRLRNTLIHELCHSATWLIDGVLKAGHGPMWKKWAARSLQVYPELGEIPRCHTMEIHFKYTYKCTKCGYSFQRHSKSIDITKKACGYCRGTFEIHLNRKIKDGVVVSTPARKGKTNEFAKYVKENYGIIKDSTKTHAQVMKILGEQFSAEKNKPSKIVASEEID